MNIDTILQYTLLDNTVKNYLIMLAVFVVGVIAVKIFKTIVLKRLKKWAEVTTNKYDDFMISLIEINLMPLLYFGAFYLSVQYLTLQETFAKYFNMFTFAIFTIVGIRFVISLLDFVLQTFWINKQDNESTKKSLLGIFNIIKGVIWAIGIILLFDNLGFKVPRLGSYTSASASMPSSFSESFSSIPSL